MKNQSERLSKIENMQLKKIVNNLKINSFILKLKIIKKKR